MENQHNTGGNLNYLEPVDLPNATAVLVLGIGSLFGLLCYVLPGLIMAIIALVLASGSKKQYLNDPAFYTKGSVSNMRAGKICAIISVCLFVFFMLLFAFLMIGFGFGWFKGLIPFKH